MDVGWGGVILIWFGFLWPAIFVIIYKLRARREGSHLNGLLALVISYAVYIGASYFPVIPLWILGVEGFIERVGEAYGEALLMTIFVLAILFATGLLLFIFRKLEKKIAA